MITASPMPHPPRRRPPLRPWLPALLLFWFSAAFSCVPLPEWGMWGPDETMQFDQPLGWPAALDYYPDHELWRDCPTPMNPVVVRYLGSISVGPVPPNRYAVGNDGEQPRGDIATWVTSLAMPEPDWSYVWPSDLYGSQWTWRWETHWTSARPVPPGSPSQVYIRSAWPDWPEVWVAYPYGAGECTHGWTGVWAAYLHGYGRYDYAYTPRTPSLR